MPKTFVLHDESVNTYGFRMLTSGANLEEFRRNPVMLYNHNSYDLPIGRWDNIRIEGGKILADAVFDDAEDPRAKEIAGKVERGMLRMASIGAWPPEEVSDAESLRLPGQTGVTVTRWTVREASICTIGSNHNALVLYDRRGERIDLSDKSSLIALMDVPVQEPEEQDPVTDNPPSNNQPTDNNPSMSKLTTLLQLSDGATQEQIDASVEGVVAERDNLRAEVESLTKERDQLKSEAEARAEADKTARAAEAVALVDAAIRDGRIDAASKDTYIKLFDADHDAAKAALGALPRRRGVAQQLQETPEGVELSDKASPWERELASIRESRAK